MVRFAVLLAMILSPTLAHASSAVTTEELVNQPPGDATESLDDMLDAPVTEFRSGGESVCDKRLSELGLSFGRNDADVYVARGEWHVSVAPESGEVFLRARNNAFYIAFSLAKNELVKYLGSSIERDSNFEVMLNLGRDIDPEISQMRIILKKTADLTEKNLDKAILNLDPSYDSGQYQKKEKKKQKFKDAIKREIKERARGWIVGSRPIAVCEGEEEVGDGSFIHKVVVDLVWSPNAARDAWALHQNNRLPGGQAWGTRR